MSLFVVVIVTRRALIAHRISRDRDVLDLGLHNIHDSEARDGSVLDGFVLVDFVSFLLF